MPARLFYFLPLLPLLFVACSPDLEPQKEADSIQAWLPLKINEIELEAQIAISPSEMQKGLMYRESLPENGGMLFAYREAGQMSFWMANTPLPLDIGFFDRTGLLLEIHRLLPYDTTPIRSRGRDIQYALEMNSGWFAGKGLYPGARMDLDTLAVAISRRGTDPLQLGLPQGN